MSEDDLAQKLRAAEEKRQRGLRVAQAGRLELIEAIQLALDAGWNRSKIAREGGLSRPHLYQLVPVERDERGVLVQRPSSPLP